MDDLQPARTCGPRRAAELTGLGYPGQFNTARRRLERVAISDGVTVAYPDFSDGYSPLAVWGGAYDSSVHRDLSGQNAEGLYRRTYTLLVPEWGGVRIPGTEWTYDEDLCAGWRRRLCGHAGK